VNKRFSKGGSRWGGGRRQFERRFEEGIYSKSGNRPTGRRGQQATGRVITRKGGVDAAGVQA